jgi:glycerol-3-phosphate acyltransferase PlsY
MIYLLKLTAAAVTAYLLGSFNTAVVVSRSMLKDDIRQHGSGNAGATNALRVMGRRLAALVMVGDVLKGVLAILFAGWLLGGTEYYDLARMLAAVFVVIGHVYPLFFNFKGGKGVATTAAIMLVVDWRCFLVGAAIFLAVAFITRYSSLGSMLGVGSVPVAMWFFGVDMLTIGVSALLALFVVFLHRSNIQRLIKGEENKISVGKRKK